jgi:phosphate transport system permease protein
LGVRSGHDLVVANGSLLDEQAPPIPREITTQPRFSDRVFRLVITAGGFTSLLVLGLIAAFLAYRGLEVFRTFGYHFITNYKWDGGNPDAGVKPSLGIGAMLIGTVVISLVALAVALPISVGASLFLTYYVPNFLRKPLTILIDLMAAIPSVVYGLWGFFVLMPHAVYWAKLLHKYLGWIPVFDVPLPIFERSPFIAGLVLAVMIIPIITAISREVFTQVPLDRVQAAYALGATRWSMIRAVVLPFGSSGITGGAMLGLGRAMGETVAVYLVLNLAYKANFHILFSSGGSIASMIVNKFGEASPFELKGLMAAGLVLFVITLLVNYLANLIVRRTARTGR